MKLIKPHFWANKNYISYTLYPLSVITYSSNQNLRKYTDIYSGDSYGESAKVYK